MISLLSAFRGRFVDSTQSISRRHYIHMLRSNGSPVPDQSSKILQFNGNHVVFSGADGTFSEKQVRNDISPGERHSKYCFQQGILFDSTSGTGQNLQICASVPSTNTFKAKALKLPYKNGSVLHVGSLDAICAYLCPSETERLKTPQIKIGPKWVSFLHST